MRSYTYTYEDFNLINIISPATKYSFLFIYLLLTFKVHYKYTCTVIQLSTLLFSQGNDF